LIRYLKNREIDTEKWDACIRASFNGIVYAYSWYLDTVHEDWDALVEDDYVRVMPLPVSKKMGVSYIMQPYFVQQLGVFSKDILTPEIVASFLDHIPASYRIVDINLNSFNTLKKDGYEIVANNNYVLDLINKYPSIVKRYATNTKRNLKKSEKNSLTLVKGVKPEMLIKLFKDNRGKTLKKWNKKEYDRLLRLIYRVMYKGGGLLYGVYDRQNQLCAAAFFLRGKNRLIFLFSATNHAGKRKGAMTFLIDHVIREFSPGKLILDFEGSNDKNMARFYRGFGAKKVTYIRYRRNNLNFVWRWLFKAYMKVKNN